MFRQMRRKNQELLKSECDEILLKGKTGTLAVVGDEDYPYAVPLNYIYLDDKIYFHCAKEGHKIDSIKKNDKVSFCVVEKDEVVPEVFGTDFRSVIVFGRARFLAEDEIIPVIEKFTKKYCPKTPDNAIQNEINKDFKRLCMVEIKIEHMTGKQAIEFVRKANQETSL
ncbi:MAG: pyridoxamine 5'-phosphate oxidase family protein [Candidatus Gastranaerophilales bacterium]|nr:pyridoxamine 5'-phosphate oxidase family protein [Candidatus Gastranaerophilales bacterium]